MTLKIVCWLITHLRMADAEQVRQLALGGGEEPVQIDTVSVLRKVAEYSRRAW